MDILIINGHDYSRFIQRKGYGWSRNDLDSEQTTRLKNGTMRRHKITTKRKLSYTLMNMNRAQLAQLDNDLSAATFTAKYLDLHGPSTRTFYCSSFAATCAEVVENETDVWEGASFSMTEV